MSELFFFNLSTNRVSFPEKVSHLLVFFVATPVPER